MGKKKSVVLMTLITIVLLVLCAVVAFPRVTIPGTNGIKSWNPAAMQYDLGAEFSGGHYAYYYPTGVITEAEYKNNLDAMTEEKKVEYAKKYAQYGTTSLYLSTDPDDCILDEEGQVTESFKTAFASALAIIKTRFENRAAYTGSTYRVSVVDDYAIRVDLSATENTEGQTAKSYALQAFAQYAKFGDLSLETVTSDSSSGSETREVVSQLKSGEMEVKDLIKSITVKTRYEVAYLRLTFTSEGKEMLKEFKNSDASSLVLTLGDDDVLQITTDYITSKNEVEIGQANEGDILYAETLCVLLNSLMEDGGVNIGDRESTPFTLRAPTQASEINTYEPVYGDNLVWVYVVLLVVILALSVFAIVKMGGFGVMNLYTTVSYLVITALCFAFISGGVFAVTYATVFTFMAGLLLVNVLNGYIYRAIQSEAALGKTMQSSVKNGYKKTLWTLVDVYAALLLGALALLIGVAGLQTIATQALICIVAGAFCNLLWGRVINLMMFSVSKDKYKYFRFVREDDGDDE